jgi:hypothetical protein
MMLLRAALLLPVSPFLVSAALAAPAAGTGGAVYSDLCRTASGFQGSRLTLTAGHDGGAYQWGDSAADTAPISKLVTGADGRIAFRYMPDADNPEVYIAVTGTLSDDAFTGAADGKPLRLPRARDSGTPIPACR